MSEEQQLYDLTKELVEQMTGEYTEDIQNPNFQIAHTYLSKALNIRSVSNCKRDESLELLEEIMTKVNEANEEVENGIYDPMLEVAKHILNNYKIERR